MVNILSALTAITVYMRLCELGQAASIAIICGMCIGALSQRAFKQIIKMS